MAVLKKINGKLYVVNGDVQFDGNSLANLFFLDEANDIIVIGSNSGDASAILDLISTAKGLGLPSMTTTQRDNISTPREGLLVSNLTTNLPNYYNGSSWAEISAVDSQSVAKGWVYFDGTGTLTVNDSFNVTSVTDIGTGAYDVNWDTDFANTNYSAFVSGYHTISVIAIHGGRNNNRTKSVGTFPLRTWNDGGTVTDALHVHCVAFGDQ